MNSLTRTRPGHAPARTRAAAHPPRSNVTRVLHLVLLVAVIHQLVGSEFMAFPFPGDPPSWWFSLHEYIGIASVAILGAFWLWTLVRRGETRIARLIPWLSPMRTADVLADAAHHIESLLHRKLPDDDDGALASAIHGLGLLAVTFMAITGTVFYYTHGTPLAHDAMWLHRTAANLIWVYLAAHASLAILHHLLGSNILSRMFWTKTRRRPYRPAPRKYW